MVYTDDTLILLGDTDASLRETMATITEFDSFSGLTINWSKSALMLQISKDSGVPMSQIFVGLIYPHFYCVFATVLKYKTPFAFRWLGR